MATIQLLQGTEKIKDSYTKINTSVTNLNNAKMEKSADSDLDMNRHNIKDIAAINFGDWETVTIDGNNAITVTKTHVRIDTSGGPGELHTINGGTRGQFIFLRCVTGARPVTIKHNVGNILTNDGLDIPLNNGSQVYILLCLDGSIWCVVGNVGVRRNGDTMTGNLSFGPLMGLEFRNGNAATTADLVNFPEVTGFDAVIRLFRNTNTTGNKYLRISKGDGTTAAAFEIMNGAITTLNGQNVTITAGTGSPQGVVAAPAGSIYLNTSGGANATIWVKESGTGNTGWVAK